MNKECNYCNTDRATVQKVVDLIKEMWEEYDEWLGSDEAKELAITEVKVPLRKYLFGITNRDYYEITRGKKSIRDHNYYYLHCTRRIPERFEYVATRHSFSRQEFYTKEFRKELEALLAADRTGYIMVCGNTARKIKQYLTLIEERTANGSDSKGSD